jgi:hypothetical protein
MQRTARSAAEHEILLAAALYLGLALVLTWPVAPRLASHLAGRGGDGFAFAWNLWWTKKALVELHASPLSTTWLFHPEGMSLVFHTHTLANGLLAVPLLGSLGVPATYNLLLLLHLAAGALAAHLLARYTGAGRAGAVAAGLVFGFSSHVTSQADYGEQNLCTVSWVGFFVYFFHRALAGGGRAAALASGLFLALSAYNDYTLFVAGLVAAAAMLAVRLWEALPAPLRRPLAAGLAAGFLALSLRLHGHALAPPGTALALVLAGLALGFARLRGAGPRPPAPSSRAGRAAGQPLLAGAAFLIAAAPLLWAIAQQILTQDHMPFRSGRLGRRWGTEIPGLFVPSELHPHLGWLHALYWGPRGTHPSQFLGLVAPLLAALGWRRSVRPFPWRSLTLLFLGLSLGPDLELGPDGLKLRGPFHHLSDLLPIAAGIRAPSRLLALVHLGLAVGTALSLTRLLESSRSRRLLAAAALGLLLYERLSCPFPTVPAEPPAAYEHLLREPDDGRAVLELPLGFRTGTSVDPAERTVYQLYQCSHGRPLTTGFAARGDPELLRRMRRSPIARLLRDLAQSRFPDQAFPPAENLRPEAERFLRELRIGHILLHATALHNGPVPTPVLSRQSFERLMHWIPRLFPVQFCGQDQDWACFHVQATPP